MVGEASADTLSGGDGDDLLMGSSGADRLEGGKGNDKLFGGAGADTLNGAAGTNVLLAGAGDDTFIGGVGTDSMDGGTGSNTATSRDEFDIVNAHPEWDFRQRKGITHFRGGIFAGHDARTKLELRWCKDVGTLTILVLDESDTGGTIRVVLDTDDLGGLVAAETFEVDQAVTLVMTTADVTAGDAPRVVTATTAAEGDCEALLRRILGDLVE
jgi:hypothetical protein